MKSIFIIIVVFFSVSIFVCFKRVTKAFEGHFGVHNCLLDFLINVGETLVLVEMVFFLLNLLLDLVMVNHLHGLLVHLDLIRMLDILD